MYCFQGTELSDTETFDQFLQPWVAQFKVETEKSAAVLVEVFFSEKLVYLIVKFTG